MNPLDQITIPLLEWYRDNARTLPWREDVTPYRVWVSEIMLQQTRVTAVLGYFARFMDALPTVEDLSAVSEDQLLKLWQGLGYYSRARNLQKGAQKIMNDFGGVFPTDYDALRTLAGVGEYTAAAIASIAFGEPYPSVDGNLLRVVARLTADFDDITTAAMKKKVTKSLEEVIPLQAPGAFNQAMMDLGAMVCLPNGAPLCARCPLSGFCMAHQSGQEALLPVRTPKKARRIEERDVFLIVCERRVALRKRPAMGLLARLWEFPCEIATGEDTPILPTGAPMGELIFRGTGRHIFTHVEWHMRAFVLLVEDMTLPSGWVWASRAELADIYAIPNAYAGFLPILDDYQ